MKKTLSILFALALVLSFSLVATTPVAAQTTYYVATTGDDSTGDGGAGSPWATIQHAVDSVVAGDTIIVSAGTYFGATGNKAVTIEAKTGDVVIINDGPNTHTHSRAGFYFAGDYSGSGATIRGFNIQGAIQFGTADDGKLDFAVFSCGANDVVIEKNVISDMLQGITSWHGNGWLIDDNVITDLWCRNGGGIGVFVGAFNGATVEGNVISNNVITGILSVNPADGGGYSGTGIALMADFRWGSAGGTVKDNIVSDNYVSITSDTPGTVNFQGMQLTDSRADDANPAAVLDNQVVWNSILGNGSVGIRVSAGTSGNSINFNSIVDNPQYGVLYLGTGTLDATNNWWDDASGPYHATGNPGGTGDAVSDNVNFVPWYFVADPDIPITSYDDIADTATGSGPAEFGASAGTIQNLTVVPEAALPLAGKPPLAFPHGFFALDIVGVTPGATVTVSIMLPQPVPTGTQYWKYYLGAWRQIPMTIDPNDSRIIHITLVDGGLGDADGLANGTIIDQGGPGNPVTVGWEGSSVNKAAVMAPWLALLAAMMVGGGLFVLRRRRAQI